MAQPTPRSYPQILGDMVTTFLVRKQIPKLKAGSPVLTVMEAAAQSDVRNTQDLFALLNAQSLDRVDGNALDTLGASEGVVRRPERAANGVVTFLDISFQKKSTRISPARAAPISGSTTIYLVDAVGWPTTGSIYLGRDVPTYEGPVAYTSLVDSGSYWTMTLATPLQRFHPQHEGVVLAQGGDRSIPAGQQVTTPLGQSTPPVTFTTLYPAVIPDGETSVSGVVVVCSAPGTVGNVPQSAISVVSSPPFPSCGVTNSSSFVTGVDTESDNDYRDRIKADRANRTRATDAALTAAAVGVSSVDDARRVVSAALVRPEGETAALIIDDGTGYEERSDGVALEPLIDSAIGGERNFRLSFRPVARAFVASSKTAPFALTESSYIAVMIGGVRYEHYLSPSSFRDITAATAYEVVASVNADPIIPLSARTTGGGTGVVLYARRDTNEDLQIVTPASGDDANDALGFTTNAAYTLKLYKNDRLLTKDGTTAALSSAAASQWSSLSGTETLILAVDSTPAVTYSFTGQDFIDAQTGFVAMGANSAAAWAAVLNARIPGTTTVANGDILVISSNSGRSARSKLQISGGTLVSKGVFALGTATGKDSDYTLNVNTSEIRLKEALAAGDSLAAGSFNTRAFVESVTLSPTTLLSTADMWVVADGDGEQVIHGVTAAGIFDLTVSASGAWGERWALTASSGTPFSRVQEGDWLIVWDANVPAGLRSTWRVAAATSTSVEFDTPVTGIADVLGFSFANADLRFVRASTQPQKISIPAGTNYTATSFTNAISLNGITAVPYRTTKIRMRTKSFGAGGSIAVVAMNSEAAKLGISETALPVENIDGHLASVEAAAEVAHTPTFNIHAIVAESVGLTDVVIASSTDADAGFNKLVIGERARDTLSTGARWGNNQAFRSVVASLTTGANTTLVTRETALNKWAEEDILYYANPYSIAPGDSVGVVIDGSATTKRFVVPLSRTLKGVGPSYGQTNEFVDVEAGNISLAQTFGLNYPFEDMAVFMHARVLTHSADAGKRILWRWKRMGPDGEKGRIRYAYPRTAGQALAVELQSMQAATAAFPESNQYSLATVRLPSGSAKTGYSIRSSTRIGVGSTAVSGVDALTIAVGFPISSAQRTGNVTTLTLTLPTGLYSVTDHSYQIGDQIYVDSNDVNYSSGLKTLTGRTATTVSYAETAANFGPTANIGKVSSDVATAGFNGASPAIVVGDIVSFEDVAVVPALVRGRSFRITHMGDQFVQGYTDFNYTGTQNTLLAWSALADATRLSVYPLNTGACTATAIAAAVNALNETCPVTATVTGTGAGSITLSSREELLTEVGLVEYAGFLDGVNWVQTSTSPVNPANNYQLLFKKPVSSALAVDSDWANEEVELLPITSEAVVNWLNTPAVSGLSSAAVIEAARNGLAPQIVSLTPGLSGSVLVQGGSGNRATAVAVGPSVVDTSAASIFCGLYADSADVEPMRADHWVRLENGERHVKTGRITSATAVTSISANGTVVLSAGPFLRATLASGSPGPSIVIRPEGRFMAYIGINGALAAEGDWLDVRDVSAPNAGIFRIVRATSDAVWVENPSGVAEYVADNVATWFIYGASGMMPGDQLSISSSAWGAGNIGVWTVESVIDSITFKLDTSSRAMIAQGAIGALGATEAAKFVLTGSPLVAYKQIHSIDPQQGGLSLIKLKGSEHGSIIGEGFGTVMTVQDKLAFPESSLSVGSDGYRYSTGLVGEVNRVIYGDRADPVTYPGYAGAGVKVNITGPLARRVSVAMGLRLRLGVLPADVIRQVRAAVAAAINGTPLGRPIAISALVSAAMGVSGVIAVSVISPAYSSANDLIEIQPDEKALVLDAERDISISIVGE